MAVTQSQTKVFFEQGGTRLVAETGGWIDQSIATIAATGAAASNAATLTSRYNLVTASDGTKGVILSSPAIGRTISVKNTVASALLVYPSTGAKINGGSANAAVTQAASTESTFVSDGTDWWSFNGTLS